MAQRLGRPLKVGLALSTWEDKDGNCPRWSDLTSLVRNVEAVGFDLIWLADHLIYKFPKPGTDKLGT